MCRDTFAPTQAPLHPWGTTTTRPYVPGKECKPGARPAGQGLESNQHCGWVVGAS